MSQWLGSSQLAALHPRYLQASESQSKHLVLSKKVFAFSWVNLSFCCQLHLRCRTLGPTEVRENSTSFGATETPGLSLAAGSLPWLAEGGNFGCKYLFQREEIDHSRGCGSSRNPGTLLLSNKETKRKFLVQKLLKCPSKQGFNLLLSHKSKPFPFWVNHFLQH